MLEYKKRILLKVSFDLELFEKELSKANQRLIKQEIDQLRYWCFRTFSSRYFPIVERTIGEESKHRVLV